MHARTRTALAREPKLDLFGFGKCTRPRKGVRATQAKGTVIPHPTPISFSPISPRDGAGGCKIFDWIVRGGGLYFVFHAMFSRRPPLRLIIAFSFSFPSQRFSRSRSPKRVFLGAGWAALHHPPVPFLCRNGLLLPLPPVFFERLAACAAIPSKL